MLKFKKKAKIKCPYDLVEMEAKATGGSANDIFEKCILERYLQGCSETFATDVRSRIRTGTFSIENVCLDIFCYYAATPDRADNSLYPLIDFVYEMEKKSPTEIKGNEQILHHLLDQMDSLCGYIKSMYEEVTIENCEDEDDLAGDIWMLEKIDSDIKEAPYEVFEKEEIAEVLQIILKNWDYSDSSYDLISFKKWTRIYRLLGDICRLARWEETPEDILMLLQIVSQITEDNAYGSKE